MTISERRGSLTWAACLSMWFRRGAADLTLHLGKTN